MPRDLIVGTAGHIDHGKTALIRALTGVDCDRLPEEKARGITIDLGFARLDFPDVHLGIVDVPGHERFLRNMLAGATGIDLALLVVAADDGVMPQTREHLEILRLLALRAGIIVFTKCDLASATRRVELHSQIRQLVQGTFLESAPRIETSATTGEGIDILRNTIHDIAKTVPDPEDAGWFHLPIDRAFLVPGHGTVVTGSVRSGRVAVGEELERFPGGDRIRVRGLQHHDHPIASANRGQRAALNLAQVPLESVHRGQELATPGIFKPSRWLTLPLHTLPSVRKPLRHGLPVRVHLGTVEQMGRLFLLESDELPAGESQWTQLILDEAVVATWGRPVILRDSSAEHTLGGGTVTAPTTQRLKRRDSTILRRLTNWCTGDAMTRLAEAAWFAGVEGIDRGDCVREVGIPIREIDATYSEAIASGTCLEWIIGKSTRLFHAEWIAERESQFLARLDTLHQQSPMLSWHRLVEVWEPIRHRYTDEFCQALVGHLCDTKRIEVDQHRIRIAGFQPRLSPNLAKLKQRIVHEFRAARFQPPEPSRFIAESKGLAVHLPELFERCITEGELVRLSDGLYLASESERELRQRVTKLLATGPQTVAQIRDCLGTTRKYAVPFCEYLDRIGVTRREGDLRYLGESVERSEE
ncbi:selenocysteine-specific translation elongation factor [Tuwongella immobilis]|uniref:Tr-type G domain-containing protein n=1 Tax=Tuwongella immobilis TaxID=692036 RepID=A0A6C2YR69_9BACT|nr:selenocysteine-specific translation elongation factor [Tuwongella immobilis]VIP03603.1 translation elongation factor : Selenocysteine-specific elongation factor OS=uncultured planctomycete GN=HGMM_F37F03C06 PE=4 SV=1: GTP_EFTU: GTP_EFTU_D2: SelB-wing_3 [Tuwongella immobilis]VTS04574.1 translation elongation factor : Selenocysteine-specific elongation factor OS=uncultured planctomycete GN=HGMM_F37F03C06 PE=4 SV=1: GTP_EFTU: GTP_EFTU_D2: SelB-wing_3 [Tuwongella immobilis]